MDPNAPQPSTAYVLAVIASLDGGYNLLGPDLRLGVEVLDDQHARYTLTSEETGEAHAYLVTVEQAPPTQQEEPE